MKGQEWEMLFHEEGAKNAHPCPLTLGSVHLLAAIMTCFLMEGMPVFPNESYR